MGSSGWVLALRRCRIAFPTLSQSHLRRFLKTPAFREVTTNSGPASFVTCGPVTTGNLVIAHQCLGRR